MSSLTYLSENFISHLNKNFNIKSFDQLKEIFLFESEKIFKFICLKKKEILIKLNDTRISKKPYETIKENEKIINNINPEFSECNII